MEVYVFTSLPVIVLNVHLNIYSMSDFKFGPIQEKWLHSLENNPERQMKDYLGEKCGEEYKACCLGELALIAGVADWDEGGLLKVRSGISYSYCTLPNYKDLGLRSGSGASNNGLTTLANLNDEGVTWPEIAKIIRENPENYLSKSV